MDRSNKELKETYKCKTANTIAIWQHAAHTTNQLTSPICLKGAIQKSPEERKERIPFGRTRTFTPHLLTYHRETGRGGWVGGNCLFPFAPTAPRRNETSFLLICERTKEKISSPFVLRQNKNNNNNNNNNKHFVSISTTTQMHTVCSHL